MLVLTRKHNETLHIGDDIVITIVRVRGDAVRIGIEAPKNVHIMRSELVGTPAKAETVPSESNQMTAPCVENNRTPTAGTSQSTSSKKPVGSLKALPVDQSAPLAKFRKAIPKPALAIAS